MEKTYGRGGIHLLRSRKELLLILIVASAFLSLKLHSPGPTAQHISKAAVLMEARQVK